MSDVSSEDRISTMSKIPTIASESVPVERKIASCALDHFHRKLSNKGKPKPGQEWTVFAAIVAVHQNEERLWVVSCATGTKCTTQRYEQCILHDLHAEVLARRGLIRVVLAEISEKKKIQDDPKDGILQQNRLSQDLLVRMRDGKNLDDDKVKQTAVTESKYEMNPDIGLHMYISDSPCGDASIYRIPNSSTNGYDQRKEILYTGAKVIVSKATQVGAEDCGGDHQLLPSVSNGVQKNNEHFVTKTQMMTGGATVAREATQVLGKLRTKSGRSDLPAHLRSHSHSCSDKLVLWSLLGLQGAFLTRFLHPPILPLTSLIVSGDSRLQASHDGNPVDNSYEEQKAALERAVPDRAKRVWENLSRRLKDRLPSWKPECPRVHIVPDVFVSGKAAMIVRQTEKSLSGNKRKQHCLRDGGLASKDETKEFAGDGGKKKGRKPEKISPCGMSLNWNQREDTEVLVGARGIRQGKKPKEPRDYRQLASRLSRERLLLDFKELLGANTVNDVIPTSNETSIPGITSYQRTKDGCAHPEWMDLKTQMLTLEGSPLAGWIRSSNSDHNSIRCKQVDANSSR